jgi:DNA-binding CsgD family transcriptional regulator
MAFFVSEEPIEELTSHNMSSDLLTDYISYFYKHDIFNKANLYKQGLITVNDVTSYSNYEKSIYYSEFLKKYDIYYTASIPLVVFDKQIGGIGLHKSKESGGFSNEEKLMLSQLSLYISLGLKNHLMYKKSQFEKTILKSSMQKLSIGYLVTNNNFDVLYYNNSSREYSFEIAKMLKLSDNSIDRFVKMISTYSKQFISINEDFEQVFGQYTVKVNPHHMHNQFNNSINNYYIITIKKNAESKEINLDKAAKKFLLTSREIDIVKLICAGYTNNEICEELFIGINTVKSHTKNIFNKLDIHNRSSLIFKINNI